MGSADLRRLLYLVSPYLTGADYGADDRTVMSTYSRAVLVLAATEREAREFAGLMALNSWQYVDHFRKVLAHRGATLYIIAGGREREDFPAIEGLFIQAHIKVIDMEQ